MTSQLPDELWLEVLQGIPDADIPRVSLVNHLLRTISRGRLFRHFDFHPYFIGDSGPLLPGSKEVDQALERLNFWFSDPIAPLVRSCDISPWESAALRASRTSFISSTPHVLLDNFFDHLHKLVALEYFCADDVEFTAPAMYKLFSMSMLTALSVSRCYIAGDALELPRAESSLSAFACAHYPLHADALQPWIPLLHPDHLRNLDLSCNLRPLHRNSHADETFPMVHTLSICLDFSALNADMAVLSRFPNVRNLSISEFGWERLMPVHASPPPFQALRELTVSCGILGLFVPGSSISALRILYCSTAELISKLSEIQLPQTITELSLRFPSLDDTALESILVFFPQLVVLKVFLMVQVAYNQLRLDLEDPEAFLRAQYVSQYGKDFLEKLPLINTFPPGLEALSITWESYERDTQIMPRITENFNIVISPIRDTLVLKCPSLTSLWLDAHVFAFRWRKSANGTVIEETAIDEASVKVMRETEPV